MTAVAAALFHKAEMRHARFYLQQLEVAHQAHRGQQTGMALALFDEHWSQINAVFQRMEQSSNVEFAELSNDFVHFGIDLLTMRRPVHEQIMWLTRGLDAAQILADQQNEMDYLNRLGQAYFISKSNDMSLQCYEQVLTHAQSSRSAKHEADALVGLGRVKSLFPKLTDIARTHLLDAIQIYRALGDVRGLGWSVLNLGSLEDRFGDLQVAQERVLEAITIYEKLGDQRSLATALRRLANIIDRRGDPAAAVVHLQRALDIGRVLDDIELVPACLLTMGLIIDVSGDRVTSLKLFEEALAYTYRSGNKQLMGTALINLGWTAAHLGDYPAALLYHRQCVDLYRGLNYPTRAAASITNAGFVQIQLRMYEAAEQNLREAFALLQEVGTLHDSLDVLIGFAWLDLLRGQAERGARIIGMVQANPPEKMYAERQSYLKMVQPVLEATLSPLLLAEALDEGSKVKPETYLMEMLQRYPSSQS